jgi:hypothetical protein
MAVMGYQESMMIKYYTDFEAQPQSSNHRLLNANFGPSTKQPMIV